MAKPLPIYGVKGDQIRHWLYVEDHARALHRRNLQVEVETYNIGGHNEKKPRGGSKPAFAICWMKLFRKRALSRPDHVCCRSSVPRSPLCYRRNIKIAAELGWETRRNI